MLRKAMKVCMVVRNQVVYDSRVLREAASLARSGYEVSIIGEGPGTLPERETVEGFRVIRIRASSSGRPPLLGRLYPFVSYLRAMVRQQADIYHCHDIDTLLLGFLASRLTRARFIYDSHELWTDMPSQGRADRVKCFLLEHLLLGKASGVITVGPSIARRIERLHGLKERPIVVMNCPPYQRVEGSNLIRNALSLPGDLPILYYHGKVEDRRGIEPFLKALGHISRAAVVFLGYGIGSYLAKLKETARTLGLEGRVHLLPAVPQKELIRWASSADIGLHLLGPDPALNQRLSLGNKFFEYLMAGLPVAVPAFAKELTRIVEQWKVGVVFNPEDPAQTASTLEILINDEQERKRMSQNALMASATRFRWDMEERKLLGLYQGVMQSVAKCAE